MRSDVELLRILASFGIVWFHSGYAFARDFSYSGLVIFVIFSACLAAKSIKSHRLSQRAARLLWPCVIWSFVYALFSIFRGRNIFSKDDNLINSVLATPSIHLWYLPFIFLCIVFIDWIKVNSKHGIIATFSAVLASVLLLISPFWREFNYASPFGQYMHALPAVLIGVFFGLNNHLPVKLRNTLFLMVSIVIVLVFFMDIPGVSIPYLVGVLASSILLYNSSFIPKSTFITIVSELTLGVYMTHVLVLSAFRYIGLTGASLPLFAFLFSSLGVFIAIRLLPIMITRKALGIA